MANFPVSLPSNASLLIAVDFKRTTLNGSITNSAASMTVISTTGFPDPAGATYYLVIDAAASATREIVGYTGLTGTTFTGLTRHLFSTNDIGHTSGVTVELNIVAAYSENAKSEIIALATKLGIDSSAVNTTFDYKLAQVATGDRAVALTGAQTLTSKTLTSPIINTPTESSPSISGNITMTTASAVLIPGATQWALRDNANANDNILVTNAGAITVRSSISGVTTLTATTLAGTLSTAAQTNITSVGTLGSLAVTAGITAATLTGTISTAAQANITSVGTLTALGVNGNLTFSGASRRIIAGTTDFSLRDNANANDNILVTDAGAVTLRSTLSGITTLTATTLAGTLSTASQTSITAVGTLTGLTINGNETYTGANRRIIAGTTDFGIRDNANANTNLLITDAGAITFRSTVGGITTLTATTLSGTLSTAAQASVTSLGSLTSLSTGNITMTAATAQIIGGATSFAIRDSSNANNNLVITDAGAATIRAGFTLTTGAMVINGAGTATFNRQYASTRVAKSFAGTPTFDWNDSNFQSMTLTGNITSMTLSNPIDGGRYVLLFTQDATGGRTISWPASVKWPGGTAPALSALNKSDMVSLNWNGTNYFGTSVGEF